MPTYEIGKLRLVMTMDDMVSKKKDKLIQNFKKLDGAVNKSAQQMQTAGKTTGVLGNAMSRLRFTIDPLHYAFRFLQKTVVDVVKTSAEFEQAIHNVGAVAHATSDDLNTLAEAAKMPAVTELGYNALEAANSMYIWASAGYDVEESIAALEGTLTLAAATQYDLNDVTKTMIGTIKQFGLVAEDTAQIADIFAGVIADSQATMEKFAKSMQYAGAIANTAGLSLQETSTALGLLYNAGITASMAGTGLRRVISGLIKTTKEGTAILEKYGLTYEDINPEVHSFREILASLMPMVDNAGDLMELFGLRGGPAMAAMLKQGTEAFDDLYESTQKTGTAAWQAEMQLDTLQGATKQLKGEITELYTNIGSYLIPTLNEGANTLYYFVGGLNMVIGSAKEAETELERLDETTQNYIDAILEEHGWTKEEATALNAHIQTYAMASTAVEKYTNDINKYYDNMSNHLAANMSWFASFGAIIGTLAGPLGTLAGAGIGALTGALSTLAVHFKFAKDNTDALRESVKLQTDALAQLKDEDLAIVKAQESIIGTTDNWVDVFNEVAAVADNFGTKLMTVWAKTEELNTSFQKLSDVATYFGKGITDVDATLLDFYDLIANTNRNLVESDGSISDSVMQWYAYADSIATTDSVLSQFIKDTLDKMILDEAEKEFRSFGNAVKKSFTDIGEAEDARDKVAQVSIETDRRMAEMMDLVRLSGESLIELFGPQWGATFLGSAMTTDDFNETIKAMRKTILDTIIATEDLYDIMQDQSEGTRNYAEQQKIASAEGQRFIELFRGGVIDLDQFREAMSRIGEEGFGVSQFLNELFARDRVAGPLQKWGMDIEEFVGEFADKFDEDILRQFFEQADANIEPTIALIQKFVDSLEDAGDAVDTLSEIFAATSPADFMEEVLSEDTVNALLGFADKYGEVWAEISSRSEEELSALDWKKIAKLYEEGGGDAALAYLKGFMEDWDSSDAEDAAIALAQRMGEVTTKAFDLGGGQYKVVTTTFCEETEKIVQCFETSMGKVLMTQEEYDQYLIDEAKSAAQEIADSYSQSLNDALALTMTGPAVQEGNKVFAEYMNSFGETFTRTWEWIGNKWVEVVDDIIDNTERAMNAIDNISESWANNTAQIEQQITTLNNVKGQLNELLSIAYHDLGAANYFLQQHGELWAYLGSQTIGSAGQVQTAISTINNELEELNQMLQDIAEEEGQTWDDLWREMNRVTITGIQQMGDQWVVNKENICGTWEEVYECVDHQLKLVEGAVGQTLEDIWREMTSTSIIGIEELESGVRLIKEGYCGTFEEIYECVDGQLKRITDSVSGSTSSWEEDLQEIVNIINSLAGEELIEFEDVFSPATEEAKALQELLLDLQRDLSAGAVTGLNIGGGVTPEMEGFLGDLGAGMTLPPYPEITAGGGAVTNIYVNEGAIVIQGDVSDPEAAQGTLEVALEQIAIQAESEAEWGVP